MEAKLLLSHGIFHIDQMRPSRLDRRLSVHHAHNALELAFRRKASELAISPAEVYEFPRLTKHLTQSGVVVPYQRELEELNKTRELIQHYGQVPDEKEAYRLVHAAENCMKEFCASAFGVDFDQLSPNDLISNEGIRKTLTEAQEAYDSGRFEDAAVAAHFAIQQGKWIVERKVMNPRWRHHLSLHTERLLEDVAKSLDDIDRYVDDVLDVALSASFASSLRRLGEITCAVFHQIPGGKPITQVLKQSRDHDPTQDDAQFAIELAVEYLSWADQTYGLEPDSMEK